MVHQTPESWYSLKLIFSFDFTCKGVHEVKRLYNSSLHVLKVSWIPCEFGVRIHTFSVSILETETVLLLFTRMLFHILKAIRSWFFNFFRIQPLGSWILFNSQIVNFFISFFKFILLLWWIRIVSFLKG